MNKPSKKKSRALVPEETVYYHLTRPKEGNEFHDEKNFSKFFKEMSAKFPMLREASLEITNDKSEVLNLERANEVFEAVVIGK